MGCWVVPGKGCANADAEGQRCGRTPRCIHVAGAPGQHSVLAAVMEPWECVARRAMGPGECQRGSALTDVSMHPAGVMLLAQCATLGVGDKCSRWPRLCCGVSAAGRIGVRAIQGCGWRQWRGGNGEHRWLCCSTVVVHGAPQLRDECMPAGCGLSDLRMPPPCPLLAPRPVGSPGLYWTR